MQTAKEEVKEFLSHNNKHSVDIEQIQAPAVTHEQVQEVRHENVTLAHDREIHQHHHQIHVQPIHDKVVEPEQHHHNVMPVEHREHRHGKDREVEVALKEQAQQFQDERVVLPTQESKSVNKVVGEHVHHHIHDVIQPVLKVDRIQQHVVHTTIPVHEVIEKEPIIHSGNVLPTMTMEEFRKSGHDLKGGHVKREHIDHEGEPLKINPDSRVEFDHNKRHPGVGTTGAPGELGTNAGHTGTAGIIGGSGITSGLAGTHIHDGTHHHGTHTHGAHHHGTHGTHGTHVAGTHHRRGSNSSSSSDNNDYTTGRRAKTVSGPHNSNIANQMDPRVDSDLDRSRTVGTGIGTGTTTHGLTGTGGNYTTTGTTGHGVTGQGLTGQGLTGTGGNYTTTGTTGHGLTGTGGNYTTTTSTGPTGSMNYDNDYNKAPRSAGNAFGNTTNTGLGSGTTGVTESPHAEEKLEHKPSTTEKILHGIGFK